MSIQITTAFVDQFKANILLLSQQKESVLRQVCRMETMTGDTMYVERIGATETSIIADRHGDTPQVDTPHSRRQLTVADYDWGDLIDNPDKLKMLIDPQSTYAQNAVMAFNRSIDDVIITALGGSAFGGHAGGTTITNYAADECRLVRDNGAIIAAGTDQTDSGAETGLTIAKLLTCKELLDNAEIDPSRQRFFVTNPHNINQLLNTTEVKSSDYNTVKALAHGDIDTYLGFKFLMSTRLEASVNPDAVDSYAFVQDAIVLSIQNEPTVRISERADKRYSVQVYVAMTIGATRVEGPAVVQIALDTA